MTHWLPTLGVLFASRRLFWPWYTTAAQRQAALGIISTAIEEKISVAEVLERWASDERGVHSIRLSRLVALLKNGRSLPDAVEEIPTVLGPEGTLAIRFDAQAGTSTAAMRAALAHMQATPTWVTNQARQTLGYFGILVLLGWLVGLFIQLSLLPKFTRILRDYNLEAPASLAAVDWLGKELTQGWWLVAMLLLAGMSLLVTTEWGRRLRNAWFGRSLPALRELRAANVLQVLGVALHAGRPFAGALSTLARYHYDADIRHKLLFVRNEAEQGTDVWSSMGEANLLSTAEVRVLHSAYRLGNRDWLLQQLIEVKRRRARQLLARGVGLLMPAVVAVMGLFVLLQALAIMVPLVEIMFSNL